MLTCTIQAGETRLNDETVGLCCLHIMESLQAAIGKNYKDAEETLLLVQNEKYK